MIVMPAELEAADRYRLTIGAVLPRPIAWVSTMDAQGNLNLAPYSYFTVACSEPLTLLFCPAIPRRTGIKKDSWRNVEEVPEFVVNLPNQATAAAMNQTAAALPPAMSEFEWAGVTPAPSRTVRVPRVAEAPVAFECALDRIVTINDAPGGGAAIFGRVTCIYIDDAIYRNGAIDLAAYQPIGRLAGNAYCRVTDIFEMERPAAP